jgi:hypothetical protein
MKVMGKVLSPVYNSQYTPNNEENAKNPSCGFKLEQNQNASDYGKNPHGHPTS